MNNHHNCIVISQPMYFPWIGMLQQINLCDNYVYYDDVQFSRGFFNRVKIKSKEGLSWLTVPLKKWRSGQLINEVKIDNDKNWKQKHIDQIRNAYSKSPFFSDLSEIIDKVFSKNFYTIDELSTFSTDMIVDYFNEIGKEKKFVKSSSIKKISGNSSDRLIEICKKFKSNIYLTGHGAKNYLDYNNFENNKIDVMYIEYNLLKYPQQFDGFNPYVSSLDLIANCGKHGVKFIGGKMVPWRDFISN